MARRFIVFEIDRGTGQETERGRYIDRAVAQGVAENLTKYPTDATRGSYFVVRPADITIPHHSKTEADKLRKNDRPRRR